MSTPDKKMPGSPPAASPQDSLRSKLEQAMGRGGMPAPDPLDEALLSQHGDQATELVEAAKRRHQKNPDDLDAVDYLAYVLYVNRQHAQAKPLFRKLVEGAQPTARQHYYYANCCLVTGDPTTAVDQWEIAIRLDRTGTFARKARARLKTLYRQLTGEGPA